MSYHVINVCSRAVPCAMGSIPHGNYRSCILFLCLDVCCHCACESVFFFCEMWEQPFCLIALLPLSLT